MAPHLRVKVVERLLELGEEDQALRKVLLPALDEAEAEARELDSGVAPWPYEQAAKLYRRRGDRAGELRVLRRFASHNHSPGVKPARLLARLHVLETKT